MKPRDSFPNSLRMFRMRKGLSLRALAEHLSVTPQAIHKFEIKGKGLDIEYILALSELLECTPRELCEPIKSLP